MFEDHAAERRVRVVGARLVDEIRIVGGEVRPAAGEQQIVDGGEQQHRDLLLDRRCSEQGDDLAIAGDRGREPLVQRGPGGGVDAEPAEPVGELLQASGVGRLHHVADPTDLDPGVAPAEYRRGEWTAGRGNMAG